MGVDAGDFANTIRATGGEPAPLPTPPTAPNIGRYEVQSRLGAGAMGVVWLAVDPQLERKVAIKVVHPQLASSPEASARMLREARAMAKLSHRGVVAVYDAGETDGRLFIAMELIDGETLTERLRRPDLTSAKMWRERLALVLQAGRGLAAAHSAGVLHRDFKPDNVLVDRAGRVCVGDFGLATLGHAREPISAVKYEAKNRQSLADLTTTGALMGTPVYMSPEQLRGQLADAYGDQFAFCVTAYEALYRVRPFAGDERGLDALPALIERIESGEPATSPDASVVSGAVRDVLLRGMSARREDRWPDIDAVLAALEKASGLRARRRRRIALAFGVVVLALAAAGTGAMLYARSRPHQAEKRPMFRVSSLAAIAIDADGRQIAVALDRIELHRQGVESPTTIPFEHSDDRISGLGFDGDELGFSTASHGDRMSWQAERGRSPSPDLPTTRTWVGRVADGELYADHHVEVARELVYTRDGVDVRRWGTSYGEIRTLSISPDRRRFAYIDERTEQIVVVPLVGDPFRSPRISSPTAVVWTDETHLVYARGTQVSPTITELEVSRDRTGRAKELFRQPSGWIMRLAAGGGRLLFVDGSPLSRVRVIGADDRVSMPVIQDYDSARLAAEVGWTPEGELLVWNRNTMHISHGPPRGPFVDMPIEIAHEPANATFANGVLIVATRGENGRDIDAYDLATSAHLWKVAETLVAVRCTDDRRPPCIALRHSDPGDKIFEFDPIDATIGKQLYEGQAILDVALRGDGHMFLAGRTLEEIGPDRGPSTPLGSGLTNVRSVAFGPDNTLVTAGTGPASVYVVQRSTTDGKFINVMSSETELSLLVRSAPDGSALAVIGRTYAAELCELIR